MLMGSFLTVSSKMLSMSKRYNHYGASLPYLEKVVKDAGFDCVSDGSTVEFVSNSYVGKGTLTDVVLNRSWSQKSTKTEKEAIKTIKKDDNLYPHLFGWRQPLHISDYAYSNIMRTVFPYVCVCVAFWLVTQGVR